MKKNVYSNIDTWIDMPIILKVVIISLMLVMAQMMIHIGIAVCIPKASNTMEVKVNTMTVTGEDRYGDIEYDSEGPEIGVWFLSAPHLFRDLEKYKMIRLYEELDHKGRSIRVNWTPVKNG